MLKKKFLFTIIPAMVLMTISSCSKQCVIVINSGAGCYNEGEIEMKLIVPSGTKMSELNVGMPYCFMDAFSTNEGDYALPYAWSIEDSNIIKSDYVINNNATYVAHYFESQELATNSVERVLNIALQNILIELDDSEYKKIAIDRYNILLNDVSAPTNEIQLASLSIANQGYLFALKIACRNRSTKGIEILNNCYSLFTPIILNTLDQRGVALGKIFASLYKTMGELYDPDNDLKVNWFNHFFSQIGTSIINLPTVCYSGFNSFVQGAIGASRRAMLEDNDRLEPLNHLFDLFFENLLKCKTFAQASAIGKIGVKVSDAVNRVYPSGYSELYSIAKEAIEEILLQGE